MVARQRYYHIPDDAGILIFQHLQDLQVVAILLQVPIKGWRYVVFSNTLP
jgi:hypothetical protein